MRGGLGLVSHSRTGNSWRHVMSSSIAGLLGSSTVFSCFVGVRMSNPGRYSSAEAEGAREAAETENRETGGDGRKKPFQRRGWAGTRALVFCPATPHQERFRPSPAPCSPGGTSRRGTRTSPGRRPLPCRTGSRPHPRSCRTPGVFGGRFFVRSRRATDPRAFREREPSSQKSATFCGSRRGSVRPSSLFLSRHPSPPLHLLLSRPSFFSWFPFRTRLSSTS